MNIDGMLERIRAKIRPRVQLARTPASREFGLIVQRESRKLVGLRLEGNGMDRGRLRNGR